VLSINIKGVDTTSEDQDVQNLRQSNDVSNIKTHYYDVFNILKSILLVNVSLNIFINIRNRLQYNIYIKLHIVGVGNTLINVQNPCLNRILTGQ
jgi:hypothetical protein